jgi:hypothetical protein
MIPEIVLGIWARRVGDKEAGILTSDSSGTATTLRLIVYETRRTCEKMNAASWRG